LGSSSLGCSCGTYKICLLDVLVGHFLGDGPLFYFAILCFCQNPTLAKCEGEAQHLEKVGGLESSGTPECLELNSKAQNTSH